MQLTKLEQFTIAAMQVLMAQNISAKQMNTIEISERAVKQAQAQLKSLALVENK